MCCFEMNKLCLSLLNHVTPTQLLLEFLSQHTSMVLLFSLYFLYIISIVLSDVFNMFSGLPHNTSVDGIIENVQLLVCMIVVL